MLGFWPIVASLATDEAPEDRLMFYLYSSVQGRAWELLINEPLTVVSKLLEGILRGRIHQHLDSQGLIKISHLCALENMSHKFDRVC